MGKTAGVITINLNAGVASFVQDLNKAKSSVRDFGAAAIGSGHGTRQSMIEASASLRALEGNFNNNIRAVERFTSVTLGMGPIFNKLFPLVGGLAFGTMLVELGNKVVTFFKDMKDAPEKINGAFRDLQAPLKLTNDQLAVTNDRLQADIDRLEGRRQNTLKLALDEASVAADRLADALDKDLKALNAVLKENEVGALRGILTGQARTTGFREAAGGRTGYGGDTGRIDDIRRAGQAEIDAAVKVGDLKAQEAATNRLNVNLMKEYDAIILRVSKDLAENEKHQAIRADELRRGMPSFIGFGYESLIEQQKRSLDALRAQRSLIPGMATEQSLTKKKESLLAARDNDKLTRPFEDKIKELDAEIQGISGKLAAVGQDRNAEIMAKAWAETVKQVAEVNKVLEKRHSRLTMEQQATIAEKENIKAAAAADLEWQTKLEGTTALIKNQTHTQEMLTAAIGKGYAALKAANVETQLMQAIGPREFNDPAFMAANKRLVDETRAAIEKKYEAEHTEQIAKTTDKLGDQIELERSLAQVQAQGAEAVRLVTFAYRLREMVHMKYGAEAIKAEVDLFNATRANVVAVDLSKINERLKATKALATAQLQGAEAERKAGLESKYAEMAFAGKTKPEVDAQRKEDEASRQHEITAEALKSQMAFRNQLETLSLEKKRLEDIRAELGNSLMIQTSLRRIERERLQTMTEQLLSLGTAKAGLQAFFTEMQEQSKRAAYILYETLNSAVEKVSDSLAKLMTGQKASWGQMFQGIGEDLLRTTVKGGIQRGIGALGKVLGVPGATKADGSKANPFWVQIAGVGGVAPSVGGIGSSPSADQSESGTAVGAIAGGGSAKSGIGGFLGSLIGLLIPHAAGGDVSPSSAYLVGEHGPEILYGASGRVVSNADSRRMASSGGSNHYYSIDARGADPAIYQQRTEAAIRAAHDSAVGMSIRASHDMARRVPARA